MSKLYEMIKNYAEGAADVARRTDPGRAKADRQSTADNLFRILEQCGDKPTAGCWRKEQPTEPGCYIACSPEMRAINVRQLIKGDWRNAQNPEWLYDLETGKPVKEMFLRYHWLGPLELPVVPAQQQEDKLVALSDHELDLAAQGILTSLPEYVRRWIIDQILARTKVPNVECAREFYGKLSDQRLARRLIAVRKIFLTQ